MDTNSIKSAKNNPNSILSDKVGSCGPLPETCTLKDLFGGSFTLVIPDMQRNYCWGSNNASPQQPTEKVGPFISNLLMLWQKTDVSTDDSRSQQQLYKLGLLYVYEYPAGSGRLSLIDGQQRITTLYLLLGMLYRRVPSQWLRQLLISEYELLDDRQPKLLYESRREAAYFLSDLVTHFFLNRDGRLSQLEHSKWYYQSYTSDPSAVSFINAIRSIDVALEKAVATMPECDFEDFACFVANRLAFPMCLLPNREIAEKMFIIINTTGEPLTRAQNLRSMTLAFEGEKSQHTAERFDQMEQWFWEHRDTSATEDCTCDDALEQFLNLYEADAGEQSQSADLADLRHAPHDPDSDFEKLYAYFCTYRRVCEALGPGVCPLTDKKPTTADMLAIVPAMGLVKHFGSRVTDTDIRRLWRFLANISRYQRPTALGNDLQAALRLVEEMPNADVLSWLNLPNASPRLLNKESLSTLKLIKQNMSLRDEVEQLIERAQEHPLLNGRTESLIAWATDKNTRVCDLQKLRQYIDRIYEIFGTDIDQQPHLDLVRQALLTLQRKEYPISRRGDTLMSLCWLVYDWQKLMAVAPGVVKQLLDRVRQSSLRQMVDSFDDTSYPFAFLIKEDGMMAKTHLRQVMHPCSAFVGITIVDGPTGIESRLWHVGGRSLRIDHTEWAQVRAYGTKCIYSDHLTLNAAIDLYYQPDQKSPYRIEIFSRQGIDRERRKPINIKTVIGALGWNMRLDKKRSRFYYYLPNAQAAVDAFCQAACEVQKIGRLADKTVE